MISRDLIGPQDQEGIYDNKSGVLPNKQPNKLSMRAPSFDDPTYSSLCSNKPFNVEPGELIEMTS